MRSDDHPGSTPNDEADLQAAEIGRIVSEYAARRAAGNAEPEQDLLAAHPHLADELEMHLHMLRNLTSNRATIEILMASGVMQKANDPNYIATVGHYAIKRAIGQGGMGIVLEAIDAGTNSIVAIKILRRDLPDDENARARFSRETRIAKLNHPNIVSILAVEREKDADYFAMEYVDGASLRSRIQSEGPLTAESTARYVRHLLAGLEYAHAQGVIHRDIKPSNMLLDRTTDTLKIADFGLARIQDAKTRVTCTGSVIGTPEYMSPEQATATRHVDQRTDLYSAGVVLYEMLTGVTPFRADTPSGIIHQILHQTPTNPRKVNPNACPILSTLAERLLAKRPEDRFKNATEALAALDAGKPVPSIEQQRQRRKRSLWTLSAVAAIGLAAWACTPPAEQFAKAQPDPDVPNRILVKYDNEATWHVLRSFTTRKEKPFNDAISIDIDGRGKHYVAVGLAGPLEGETENLYLLDQQGNTQWKIPLHSDLPWPDVKEPRLWWHVRKLAAGNLDGEPGDELIVLAQHEQDYPCRISIVDPHDGTVKSTFWHMGQFDEIMVKDKFFDGGHPAIIARGIANKLDGFSDGLHEGETRYTQIDQVPVLMILDPANMSGIGPQIIDPQRMPGMPAHCIPHAYAFVELPASKDQSQPIVTSPDMLHSQLPQQTWGINQVIESGRQLENACNPLFEITIGEPVPVFIVDRNLNFVSTGAGSQRSRDAVILTDDEWKTLWRPVAQESLLIPPDECQSVHPQPRNTQ